MDSAEKHNNCHQAYFEVRFPPGMASLYLNIKEKKNFYYLKNLIFTKSLILIINIINFIRIIE